MWGLLLVRCDSGNTVGDVANHHLLIPPECGDAIGDGGIDSHIEGPWVTKQLCNL